MELLNQILSNRRARNKLFADEKKMNETVDEIIELWQDHVDEPSVLHVVSSRGGIVPYNKNIFSVLIRILNKFDV